MGRINAGVSIRTSAIWYLPKTIYFFWLNPLKFAILLTTLLFFACEKDLNFLINRLEHDSLFTIEWFENNHMKLNQEKCHRLLSGNRFENILAKIGHAKIWESPKQKLLGVVIDRDLSLDGYASSLCRKADLL